MAQLKPKFKADDLGWDMGDAVKILEVVKSKKFGFTYLAAVSQGDKPRTGAWLEAFTEQRMAGIIGPDCNGDLPTHSFKLRKIK